MSEEMKNYEVLSENYEAEMRKKKKGNKEKRELEEAKLTMNSLMDILTIILVFLLKSYSTDPMAVTPSADLNVPKSTSMLEIQQTVAVTVSKSAILVDNAVVMMIKDNKVEASQKRGGEDGYFIIPLNKALIDAAEKVRRIASVNSSVKFDGVCTIVMDAEMPYRMLTEVMYTAGQAEFSKFKFLVVSKTA
ncbi:MAG TPA: biopolymer transporter ExbD [bacterium]|nr:biopolymer transporter ExbD [bacterium]